MPVIGEVLVSTFLSFVNRIGSLTYLTFIAGKYLNHLYLCDKNLDRSIVIPKNPGQGKRMLDLMLKIANNFVSFGVKKGDVVCFFVNDVDLHAISSLALIAAGGVYTGADYNYPVDEVIFQVLQSESRYIVVNDDTLDIGIEVVEQIKEMDMSRRVQLLFLGTECNNNFLLGNTTIKFFT